MDREGSSLLLLSLYLSLDDCDAIYTCTDMGPVTGLSVVLATVVVGMLVAVLVIIIIIIMRRRSVMRNKTPSTTESSHGNGHKCTCILLYFPGNGLMHNTAACQENNHPPHV